MIIQQNLYSLVFLALLTAGPLPLLIGYAQNLKKEVVFPFTQRLLFYITGWIFIQTSLTLVLSLLNRFTGQSILITEGLLFLVGIALAYARGFLPGIILFKGNLSFEKKLSFSEGFLTSLLLFLGFILILMNLIAPIKEWDSLAYHLPRMVEFYQEHGFSSQNSLSYIGRYPFNWELFSTLFFFPFNDDFLIALPNILAWFVFGGSIYQVSRFLNSPRIHGLAICGLVLMVPIVLKNTNTMHVDLALAAFFLSALSFLTQYWKTRHPKLIVLFFFNIALMIGVKVSGILYGGILVIVFMLVEMRRQTGFPLKHFFSSIFITMKESLFWVWGSFLVGGFWYIKNWIEVGNPLGMAELSIGSLKLFPGKIAAAEFSKTSLFHIFKFKKWVDWEILWRQLLGRLDMPFLMICLVCVVALFPAIRKAKNSQKFTIILIFLLTVVTLLIYWVTPFSGRNFHLGENLTPWFGQAIRYGFPFVGLVSILSAIGLRNFKIKDGVFPAIYLLVFLYMLPEISGISGFSSAILLLCAGVFFLLNVCRVFISKDLKKIRRRSLILLLPVIVFVGFQLPKIRQKNTLKEYGSLVQFISENTRRNEKIGWIRVPFKYILAGKNWDRKVVRLKARSKDCAKWIDAIKKNGIRFVARSGPRGKNKESPELKCLNVKERFIQVWRGEKGDRKSAKIVVYKRIQ